MMQTNRTGSSTQIPPLDFKKLKHMEPHFDLKLLKAGIFKREPIYTVAKQQFSRKVSPDSSFSSSNLSERSVTQERTSPSSSIERIREHSLPSEKPFEKQSSPTPKKPEKRPSTAAITPTQQFNKPKISVTQERTSPSNSIERIKERSLPSEKPFEKQSSPTPKKPEKRPATAAITPTQQFNKPKISVIQERTAPSSSIERIRERSLPSKKPLEKKSNPTLKKPEAGPSTAAITTTQQFNKPKTTETLTILTTNAIIKLKQNEDENELRAIIMKTKKENISTFNSITDFLGLTKKQQDLENKRHTRLTTSLTKEFESIEEIHIDEMSSKESSLTIKLSNNTEIPKIRKALGTLNSNTEI